MEKVPAKITSFKGQGKGRDKKDREDKGEMKSGKHTKGEEKEWNGKGREWYSFICVVVILGLFLLAFSLCSFSNSILHLRFVIISSHSDTIWWDCCSEAGCLPPTKERRVDPS